MMSSDEQQRARTSRAELDELTVDSILEQAIRALVANDTQQLADLLDATERIEAPRHEQQRSAIESKRNTLAAVLIGTERNLRLLRRTRSSGQAEIYGRIRF
jgi:hypothetical protein